MFDAVMIMMQYNYYEFLLLCQINKFKNRSLKHLSIFKVRVKSKFTTNLKIRYIRWVTTMQRLVYLHPAPLKLSLHRETI